MPGRGELYRLDFENGKAYIGITMGGSHYRYGGHARNAEGGRPWLLSKAWRKYGAPKMTVLAILEPKMLLETEISAIRVFGTLFPGGYNMTFGGETSPLVIPEILARARINMVGKVCSEEHKEKIRQAHLRRNQDPKVREKNRQAQFNWHRENKVSDETRVKLSLVSLGLKRSAATKAKMSLRVRERRQELSDNWLGDNNPMRRPEIAAKTSRKLRGRLFSMEHKEKLSAARRGRKFSKRSPEVRAKISTALKGRNLIEEHRLKNLSPERKR